jgi:riboflavin kinase/FMN adenylyltransferase
VETHLLDYSGDLYNAKIRVAFVRKLRDEMKFDGVESLVNQLHKDVAQAKVVLAEDAALLPPGW